MLWLGRFDPEKCPDLAIEACRKAGLPLVLAGKANQRVSAKALYADVVRQSSDKAERLALLGGVWEQRRLAS